jgi:hypothetical protein
MPTLADAAPRDYPGIHNAVAFHEGFVSGGVPEGDEGFASLAAMGVVTIISVDGAPPDVARATAHGLRYIHLPIGYNGFDEARRLQLVRATRDAMRAGPVYIHCHHGKHRSAGAAATIAASLGWSTPEAGVERMRVAGTAPSYRGLYACALGATVLDAGTIAAIPGEFPSVSPPTTFVSAMVEMDEIMEHLKAIERAGWRPPPDHPDLVPAAEAGRLADHLRLASAGDRAAREPAEFARMLAENAAHAQALEDALAEADRAADARALSALLARVNAACRECHAAHRD